MSLPFILLLTPILTAGIGWATNWVAIKMLFRPRNPIGWMGVRWQGLIPKRHAELARESAEILESTILQQSSIQSEIAKIDLSDYLNATAKRIVWERIGPKLQAIPLIGGFVNDSTLRQFEAIAQQEMQAEAATLINTVAHEFEKEVDLKQMIEDNIAQFELERLEGLVYQVARREFKTIEKLGALLGFLIGCIQSGLFYLVQL